MVTKCIGSQAQTRAHPRNAYYDPIETRPNLELWTGQRVDEIIFDGLVAKGVHFVSQSANNVTSKAWARREVILAAGAIFTPQILQLSGIGPRKTLEAAGVTVKKCFPGVGANFQDHPAAFMIFNLKNISFPNPNSLSENATYNASAWAEYHTDKTGPYTYPHGSSLAFLALKHLTNDSQKIVQTLKGQISKDFLSASYEDANLLRGYEAQKAIIAEMLSGEDAAAGEMPMTPTGFTINAIQRPVSRGSIMIDPRNRTGNPIVHFNSLQNPVDKAMLVAMIRWTRRHWAKKELAVFSPSEILPGVAAETDDEILSALIMNGLIMPTFSHQSGSCSMLPETLGGVVSSELLVYGTERLSIVDASIIPLIPATHLQATMYAIAEKAADLIKARGRSEEVRR